MDENKDFNGGNSNGARPDYYQPNHNGPYYNPPKEEDNTQQNNTTYHYSYNNASQTNNQNHQSSTYQPRDNGYSYNPFPNDSGNDSGSKPPKKSNASKIIVIVLVVCLIVAAVGIAAAAMGKTGYADKKDESTTAQVQSDEDAAKLNSTEAVPTKDSGGNYTVAGVYEKCVDSCVGITVYSQKADVYNYFYSYGQNGNSSDEPTLSGEGSGVLMSEQDGKTYVLTCAHVISDGDSFKVTLNDGTELDAQMVGYDSQTDIGVLAVNKTGLQIAEFGDSSELVVGEQVVAIGCPGGLEFMNSQTSGYISALDRPISSKIGYDTNCIQIDAAINPGNSGGALFNMQGQVIGINSSKIAATDYEGMGFAVPSSTAVATANSLIKVGYVEGRAKLGVTYNPITNFNNSNAVIQALEQKGFKDCQGAMVIDSVEEGSGLFGQDIKQYDMIVAVNGETMTSTDVMTSILADSKPGDTIKLTIARIENNDIKTFEIECELIESKG